MSVDIKLERQSARPMVALRMRTSMQELPQKIGQGFGVVMQYLGELGESPAGPPFAAYHNADMQNLDVELGFPVKKEIPTKNGIHAGTLPGGQAVVCLYTGPYTGFGEVYAEIAEYMKKHGYTPMGVSYEFYLNDPQTTPPEQLQTEIVFPIG